MKSWETIELRAGDILNEPVRPTWDIPELVVGLNIARAQAVFFGLRSYFWSKHTMYYLGAGKVTEFTVPECRVFDLSELRGQKLRVLRYTGYDIAANAGLCTYIAGVAESYKGKRYDYLDLLSFLVMEAVGKNEPARLVVGRLLGLGKQRLICSTYGHTLYRKVRGYVADVNLVKLPKLFGGTPVELTMPAHFDNAPADFQLLNP